MVTSDFRPEVEIWPFRVCAMHPAIILGTVPSLWTRLWGRYHVPQNSFLVISSFFQFMRRQTHRQHRQIMQVCLAQWAGVQVINGNVLSNHSTYVDRLM